MTKKQILKDLPYKTIPACEKAYKKLCQNIFDFSGIDQQELKRIKACIAVIFFSMHGDSETQIKNTLKTPERIAAFYAYKNRDYDKMCDFLNN